MVDYIDFLRNLLKNLFSGHGFVKGVALAGIWVIWH